MTPLMKFLRANVLELSYLTEKRTLIRDWRLALLYYALLGLVTAYVVTSLVNGKSYIMTEVPTGVASAWGKVGKEFYDLQKDWNTTSEQCTNTAAGTGKYMFNYSASYVYDNVKCGYFNADEMISKLPSGNVMFFATHAHQSLVARYKATEVVLPDGTVTYTCLEAAMETNFTEVVFPNGTVTYTYTCPPGSMETNFTEVVLPNGAVTYTYTCAPVSMETNFGEAAQQVVDGRCTHVKENNYIIPGMEGSTMAFDHSYDTTSGEYSGTKPKTYVQKKDSDVNEYEFAPGQSVQLTMKQWLELAGVDLDKPFDQQPGNFEGTLEGLTGGGADYSGRGTIWRHGGYLGTGTALNSTGKYPYPRLSGVRLNILVRYFNYDLHKKVHTEMGDDDVYAIVTVSPVLGWFSKGQEITYRSNPTDLTDPIDAADGASEGYYQDMYKYGILFDIQQTGLVGALDPVFIILTLTSGLVLLGVAGTIVNLLAKFGLGDLSKTYKSFIQEECDIQLEAARYTAQSIVASRAFKVADKDGEGQLDFAELKGVVTSCFSDQFASTNSKSKLQKELFSDEEIHSMTLFLMRAADPHLADRIMEGREKNVAELEASTLSLNQWQELSTSDYIDHDSLKNIIAKNKAMKRLQKQYSNA